MKVAILYNKLYEFDGTALSIGGIQTYLLRLAELIIDLGMEPVIFQLGNFDFMRHVGPVKILGKSGIPLDSTATKIGSFLAKHAENWIDGSKAIIIFGSDSYYVNSTSISIAIQHGISWDLPETYTSGAPVKLMHFLPSHYHGIAEKMIRRIRGSRVNMLRRAWIAKKNEDNQIQKSLRFMVCVDYNYLNVLKAHGKIINARIWIIPNFAELPKPEKITSKRIGGKYVRILFARRFVWYRGSRLIAPVFKRVLNSCPDVSITMAGEGPDENFLREYFIDTDRVKFLRYRHDESSSILLSHDISVIPSLGSEGTSLSAIEAMAAGCAVVATCVGGLTNIIIDGYNGKLVIPDEEDIFNALHSLVMDAELRQRLAERGFDTVQESLSLTSWREKWRQVLLHVSTES